MKNPPALLFLVWLLAPALALGQSRFETAFLFGGKNLVVSVEQAADDVKLVKVNEVGGATEKTFNLRPFSSKQFKAGLLANVQLIFGETTLTAVQQQELQQTADVIFIDAVAFLLGDGSETPEAGTFSLAKKVKVIRSAYESHEFQKQKKGLERKIERTENSLKKLSEESKKKQSEFERENQNLDQAYAKPDTLRNSFILNTLKQAQNTVATQKTTLLKEDSTLLKRLTEFRNQLEKLDVPDASAGDVTIKNVHIETEEGFIANIEVEALKGDSVIHFNNPVSIGFASKKNYGNFWGYELRQYNSDGKSFLKMKFSDLLQYYRPWLRPLTRDYSPRDDRYSFIPNGEPIRLYKDETQKLFELRVYSDFLGFDQTKPNGLVQTELIKRLNTNTYRKWIYSKPATYFGRAMRFILGESFGVFQFVTPSITLSKLEENNRWLYTTRRDSIGFEKTTLKPADSGFPKDTTFMKPARDLSPRYVSALDLLRYQNFSVGFDANLLYFENMAGKYNITLDFGLRFGNTALRDSLTKVESAQAEGEKIITRGRIAPTSQVREFSVNTFHYYPELRIQWYPDQRFGVSFAHRWSRVSVWSNQLDKIAYNQPEGTYFLGNQRVNLQDVTKSTWLNTWEISAFFKPNAEGKLFFRYRLNYQFGNRQANFQQAQVGYSFYMKRNRPASEGKSKSGD